MTDEDDGEDRGITVMQAAIRGPYTHSHRHTMQGNSVYSVGVCAGVCTHPR